MAVKPGDFLLVNYTLKGKKSRETVDTTFDSVAKDAHIHREDSTFGPKFIILGEGWLPKGLEESLVGLDPGTSKTVELTPEKGFGNRDPQKMRLVPLRRFKDREYPTPGQQVEFALKKHQSDLTIDVPEEAFYLSGLQVAKKAVTSDLQKFLPDIDTVVFQEVFKRSEPKPELPATTAKATEVSPEKEEDEEAAPATTPKKPKSPAKKKEAAPRKASTSTSRKRAKMGSENQR